MWLKMYDIGSGVWSYQIQASPQTRARALFQPYTATGKLKAVMIPATPRGFHCSSNIWPGPVTMTKQCTGKHHSS